MGFGHRVYRAEDPRARVLRRTAKELDAPRYEVAEALEKAALAELSERRPDRVLETNVEFWAAIVLDFAEVPPPMFTSMFTCARTGGLVRAHPGAEAHRPADPALGAVHRPRRARRLRGGRLEPGLGLSPPEHAPVTGARTRRCQDRPGPFKSGEAAQNHGGPTMHLDVDVAHRGRYTVLSPHGEIDVATGESLKDTLTQTLLEGHVELVVDLLDVDFIESTGLGILVGARRRARALNGSVSLVCAQGNLLKIFAITGLDKVFAISPTVEEATTDPPGPVPA